MSSDRESALPFDSTHTWWGRLYSNLRAARSVAQVLGLPAVILVYGFPNAPMVPSPVLDVILYVLLAILTMTPMLLWYIARRRPSDRQLLVLPMMVVGFTFIGSAVLWLFGGTGMLHTWWHLAVFIHVLLGLLTLFRRVSLLGWSPGIILVLSFVSLIACATLLLMLPRAHAEYQPTSFHTALFTATSAVCVTGLTIQETGTYWSREGQIVILVMIQLGGLGLMTCGAAFALLVRRGLVMRERRVLRDLLEKTVLEDLRALLLTILIFTLMIEGIGAILLSGLWSDLPFGDQVFYSLFHSISAFCNAGFALKAEGGDPASLMKFHDSWQVMTVMPVLIIIGGLGFVVLYDLGFALRRRITRGSGTTLFHRKAHNVRLSLTTKIVVVTTLVLLTLGTLGIYILQSTARTDLSTGERLEQAWFHSVSCRTAGFNTYPLDQFNPSTLFFMALLMGIGASPGSTGGGIKTVPVVVCLLTLRALMRGRERVEIGFRTIPTRLVHRALTIVVLGLGMMVLLTLVVVSIENKEDMFLKHLFEVTSALATVGLSTGITAELKVPSQSVLIFAMFLGRVGPLTVILSVAGREVGSAGYKYPEERVLLG